MRLFTNRIKPSNSPAIPAAADRAAVLAALEQYEQRCLAFYGRASDRIGLAEVARVFRRLAREHEQAAGQMASMV